ncbi:MAG: DNA-binding domain-containing protein [Rhodospirillaceae bacterium]|nr:DNA-binding domain-containing protein [Rhodospirillaceae bacterium]
MLRDLQAAFGAELLGSDMRVSAALGGDRMENAHRFGIYRNNIFASLTGVLEAAFPTIHTLVGDENFIVLASRFIAEHPPQEPPLYRYGADFATFLEDFELAVGELPFLPDLARVEWAVNEAYFEADAESLQPEDLADLDPEDCGNLQLTLHPSARLMSSGWPVWDLWGADVLPNPSPEGAQQVLILRPDAEVSVTLLSPGDFIFAQALAAGMTLGAAATAGAKAEECFDLATALGGHLGRGTFRAEFTRTAELA